MARVALAGATLVVVHAVAGAGQPPAIDPALRTVLTRDLKFSAPDLSDLESGKLIAHALPSDAPGGTGAAGGVRVTADRHAFIERYRDIVQFKKNPAVLEIGRFSDPPVIDDLAALTITRDDMDLRRCRLHECDIRLPADAIGRIAREIDWTAPDADRKAANLYKEILLAHVGAHWSGGAGAFTQYDDDERPIRPAESFDLLLNRARYLGELSGGLPEHLGAWRAHPLQGAEDFLYWSKEKIGVGPPFITVTHVTIAHPTPARDVIASRDVYSSRYLDASVSVTIASDVAGANGFLLVYANQTIASALTGRFARLRRAIVERRAKGGLVDTLRSVKRRLESPGSRN